MGTNTSHQLWPFTTLVLKHLTALGVTPPRIEVHQDEEGSDFIFGELTPELQLSEGEYIAIDAESGVYSYCFGTRGCSGGDPTYGGECYFSSTDEKALEVAKIFVEEFKP